MKKNDAQREEAREKLLEMLKPGDTVFTVLRHVSKSGMSRSISPVRMTPDGPHDLTYLAARLMDDRVDQKNGGIKVSGCGMDMGFDVVYRMGYDLWPQGFECVGETNRCPSNDHSNGDRDYTPHAHRDGGYALRHRWM